MNQPNPIAIFEMLTGYQKSFALKGAIELELFTAIGEGATSIPKLAERCSASERGVRILCDYFVVAGLLTKKDDSYGLAHDTAAFLDKRSPAYMGGAAGFLMHPTLAQSYVDVAGAVRRGGTMLPDEGTVSTDNRVWIDFARGMGAVASMGAMELAGMLDGPPPGSVLDLAAGHGLYGIEIAKRYSETQVVACDWPAVLQVAEENAVKAGVSDRIAKLAGDAMQVDFGTGYDLVLITNFLHHFDVATNEKILRKVRAALAPGGRAVTVEFVPNEDRVTPPMSAAFSLVMLASTKSGDAYTFAEFDAMFRSAGFSRSELKTLQKAPQQVLISYA